MIALGLLLILLAVGAATVAVTAPAANTQVIEMTALDVQVLASPLTIFLAGAVSVVLLSLGLAMVSKGTRRKASRRKELRTLRKDQAAAATAPPAETSTEAGDDYSRRHGTHNDTGTDSPKGGSHVSDAQMQPGQHPGSAPPA